MVAIGAFHFPPRSTVLTVTTEEVDRRTRKVVRLRALLDGYPSLQALRADLETLEAQLEAFHQGQAALSLQPGRYHHGERRALERYVDHRAAIAAVTVVMHTTDQYERSIQEHGQTVAITGDGQGASIHNAGNIDARPWIRLLAIGTLAQPTLTDGTRTLQLLHTMLPGQTLELDSDAQTARLTNGDNLLHLTSGDFPRLAPGATTLTYQGVEPVAELEVRHRDTWI